MRTPSPMRWARQLAWVTAMGALVACRGGAAGPGARAPDPASMRAELDAEGLPAGPDVQRRTIGEQIVVVRADPAYHLELDQLFDHLWVLKDQGAVFRDAQPVPLGWTTIWLSARTSKSGARYFMAQEPVYDTDPESARRDDLSVTLRVLEQQREVLRLSRSDAQPVNFDQHLLTVRGALDAPQVFLMRVPSPGGRMTGWRLAPVDVEAGNFEVDSIPVYELLARRPGLIAAMMLPDGWLAYFDGESLVGLVDPQDQLVWAAEVPDAAPAGPEAGEAGEASEVGEASRVEVAAEEMPK